MRAADCYQSRPLRTPLSAVTDIPQTAFLYTSAALGLASVFAEGKGGGREGAASSTRAFAPSRSCKEGQGGEAKS